MEAKIDAVKENSLYNNSFGINLTQPKLNLCERHTFLFFLQA